MFADQKGIKNNLGKHPVVLLSHYMAARMLWNSLHCILHVTQLGEEPTELHRGGVLGDRHRNRDKGHSEEAPCYMCQGSLAQSS